MVIQKIPLKKILSYKQGPICVCVKSSQEHDKGDQKKFSHCTCGGQNHYLGNVP